MKKIKVVILAGGFGSRISEETYDKPKPMIRINNKPILIRIMEHYSSYGFNDFVICTGYRSDYIKEYFFNLNNYSSDFEINYKTGKIIREKNNYSNWNVRIIDTGLNTMTGGRIKRVKKYLSNSFLLTYGDGVCDINLFDLINLHKKKKSLVTLTAVSPPSRFGVLEIKNHKVTSFEEKPNDTTNNLINGGYFVMSKDILNYIKDDSSILEKDVLPIIAKKGELSAFTHKGFWRCLDTIRDKKILESEIF